MQIELSKDEYLRLQAIKEGEDLKSWRHALTMVIELGSKKHYADHEKKLKKQKEERARVWEEMKAEGRKGKKPAPKKLPPSKRGVKGRSAKRARA